MQLTTQLLLSLFIASVLAEHKRVIIKVPQKTKHVFHHQIKKVPVYILIPGGKKQVEDDYDSKPSKKSRCKDNDDHDSSNSNYHHHHRNSQQDKLQILNWTEDSENQGAFIPSHPLPILNSDLTLPSLPHPADLPDVPFRTVNDDSGATAGGKSLIANGHLNYYAHKNNVNNIHSNNNYLKQNGKSAAAIASVAIPQSSRQHFGYSSSNYLPGQNAARAHSYDNAWRLQAQLQQQRQLQQYQQKQQQQQPAINDAGYSVVDYDSADDTALYAARLQQANLRTAAGIGLSSSISTHADDMKPSKKYKNKYSLRQKQKDQANVAESTVQHDDEGSSSYQYQQYQVTI